MSRFAVRAAAVAGAAAAIAACTPQRPRAPEPPPAPPAAAAPAQPKPRPCTAAAAGSPLVGTWYATASQSGIKGRLHILLVLEQDGSMRQTQRVASGRDIRSELRESGCWEASGGTLATRVTVSNGEPVDGEAAIYRNMYRVEKSGGSELAYREMRAGAPRIAARRMPAGYRLP